MKYLAIGLVLLAILVIAGWWAGWIGVVMGLCAALAAAAIFASGSDILTLPPTARKLLKFVVFIAIAVVIYAGAAPRIEVAAQESAAAMVAEMKARMAAPPRIVVAPGGSPTLQHGEQNLLIMPGESGCIKPAPGDTNLAYQVRNTPRTKGKIVAVNECDVGDGLMTGTPSGHWDKVPAYSLRIRNGSPDPVKVTVWSK